MYRPLLTICLCFSFSLFAADRHINTSADPTTQIIRIDVGGEELQVHLNSPGVKYTKDYKGYLRKLSFYHLSTHYRIHFHSPGDFFHKESVAKIARFSKVNGHWLLNDKVRTFDDMGQLLTESSWQDGYLHGSQRVYNTIGDLIEERTFEKGYPVGQWITYYASEKGNKIATLVEFPENYEKWLETYIPYKEHSRQQNLATMRPVKTTAITETWYNQHGSKQKEQIYQVAKKGRSFVVFKEGPIRYFDHNGFVIREAKLKRGTGLETRRMLSLGVEYRLERHWFNGVLIKDVPTSRLMWAPE